MDIVFRDRQNKFIDKSVNTLARDNTCLSVAATGFGKCLGKDTPVLMFDGSIKMSQDIVVGDKLMGPDSKEREVVSTTSGREDMFEVTPSKGESYTVNRSHILSLRIGSDYSSGETIHDTIINVSIDDYLNSTDKFKSMTKGWRVGVDFPESDDLPIPAYILGSWIGDGSSYLGEITTMNPEVVAEWLRYATYIDCDLLPVMYQRLNKATTYKPNHGFYRCTMNSFTRIARELNCDYRQSVPKIYKTSSRKDRLEFLAGFIDSSGYLREDCFEISQRRKHIIDSVAFIARSLGLAAYVKEVKKKCTNHSSKSDGWGTYYIVWISGDTDIIPTRVKRKQANPRSKKDNVLNVGIKVKFIGEGDYYGFSITGDRLFMLGDFTVTHNTLVMAKIIEDCAEKHSVGKTLVIQHRDELVKQNRKKYHWVSDRTSSQFDGKNKDLTGDTVFAMVQSMSTPKGLDMLSNQKFDMLAIDECHHSPASQYQKVRKGVYDKNNMMWLLGLTATAKRGDKRGMIEAGFTSIGDEVTIAELVKSGHLVPPKTLVMDLGIQDELKQVKRTSTDFNEKQVAAIMDHDVITEQVVDKWIEHGEGRQTVVFCGTVAHATNVCEEFEKKGVRAAVIHGDMRKTGKGGSDDIINRLRNFEIDVLVNVNIAIEGFDHSPISCVILLRQSSHHSAYVQMIGRGLRIINEPEWSHINKKDCIVLDFGVSTIIHGSLEVAVEMETPPKGEALQKECPMCESMVPATMRCCAFCGYDFPQRDNIALSTSGDFVMTEVDILNSSPFKWEWVTKDRTGRMAGGFRCWAGCFHAANPKDLNEHVAIGKVNDRNHPVEIFRGTELECLAAADSFVIDHETNGDAAKTKQWLSRCPTEKQIGALQKAGYDVLYQKEMGEHGFQVDKKRYGRADICHVEGVECSRYWANLLIYWVWHKKTLWNMIQEGNT